MNDDIVQCKVGPQSIPRGVDSGNRNLAADCACRQHFNIMLVAIDIWQNDITQAEKSCAKDEVREDEKLEKNAERVVRHVVQSSVSLLHRPPKSESATAWLNWVVLVCGHQ
jgi:hypothetical protein